MPAEDFFPDIFPITFQTFQREVPLFIVETKVCHECQREVLTVFLHLARWTLNCSMLSAVGEISARFCAFLLRRIASLHSLLHQTVLTMRLRGLLFGMVFSAITISFSVNESIELSSIFAMVSSSVHASENVHQSALSNFHDGVSE